MKIHTFKSGETLEGIAKQYGITKECLLSSNINGAEHAALGEELLILTPTRTHVIKPGDTPERLAVRYGVWKSDILAQNPWICTEGMTPGKTVILKYDDRMYGTAPTNGYLYPGFDKNQLECAMPYLTYVTVCSAVADETRINFVFSDEEIVERLLLENKIPLLRIFEKAEGKKLCACKSKAAYINKIVDAAVSKKYMGIVLSAANGDEDFSNYGEFIVELRRAMIGCELILILEIDESVPPEICELADGNILFYPKYVTNPKISFDDGERRFYSDFAVSAESAKAFIDIPALARLENSFLTLDEATNTARKKGLCINTNTETLISEFYDNEKGSCAFSSLGNVKSIYDIIEEYGFMGASFDISRTPITHLLMYNALFKTASHTNVRAPEGCSKER